MALNIFTIDSWWQECNELEICFYTTKYAQYVYFKGASELLVPMEWYPAPARLLMARKNRTAWEIEIFFRKIKRQ